MGFGFLLALLLSSAIQVRVTTVDGVAREVTLQGVTDKGLEIESSGKKQTLGFDKLLSVARITSPSISSPSMRVELFRGSRIAVSNIESSGVDATLTMRDQIPLILPLKQLSWVRFRGSSPTIDPQWLGMIEKPRAADVLVVRRAGDSLDEVQGIVKTITAKMVTIDMDGDDLPAPVEKLEGLLFANATRTIESGKMIVEDTQGSRWHVVSINAGKNKSLLLNLGDGIKHEIPLEQLSKLETTGSVQFLAAESPAESSFAPASKLGLNNDLAGRWLGVTPDAERDLIMRADSHVEYRIDDQYATFIGSALFDPSVTAGGKCSLRILLDGKVAWEQTFDVEDPAPRGYELPIGKAKRVRIEVKDAGDGDLGDTLRIRQPRLVK